MKPLGNAELDNVTGGFSVLGITEIEFGLKLMGQIRAVAGYATLSYGAGYVVGTGLYNLYGYLAGDSLGGDIYDLFHSGC